MPEKKVIAIVGATGAQGGGLARAILEDPSGEFSARALTRDPNSEKARELAKRGAEVVAADVDDEKSLRTALEGVHGVYCVTFFWAHFSPEREKAQARNMAGAARSAGVKHAIWSTLEDTRRWVPLDDGRMPTLMGSYKVPHFDAKGESDLVFTAMGVPTTFLLTSFYWDNFITFGMGPRRGANGALALSLPMGDRKLPGIASEDIGRCALGIFKRGPEYIGQTVGIAGEHLSGRQMATAFGKVLGRETEYHAVPFDAYRALGFPGAEDLGNMFQFKHDYQEVFCGARDPAIARALNPSLQTFEAWLSNNRSRIRVE